MGYDVSHSLVEQPALCASGALVNGGGGEFKALFQGFACSSLLGVLLEGLSPLPTEDALWMLS